MELHEGHVGQLRTGAIGHGNPVAPRAGRVADIDVFAVAGLARAVGAPLDKGAGVRLTVRVGDEVSAGDVLADVVASSQNGIDAIRADASGELFTLA